MLLGYTKYERFFKIRWEFYPPNLDTWERESDLVNCSEALSTWRQHHPAVQAQMEDYEELLDAESEGMDFERVFESEELHFLHFNCSLKFVAEEEPALE